MDFLVNINLKQNELQNAVIHPLSSSPLSGKMGQIYYNTSNKYLYQYDGTTWKPVGVEYELPIATSNILGGIKVGSGVEIDNNGTLSVPIDNSLSPTSTNPVQNKVINSALGNKANKATTLAGYGITDAKIVNGVITLGSATITPLTLSDVAITLANNLYEISIGDKTANNIATKNYVEQAISDIPKDQFLDLAKTKFVDPFTWSETLYPKSINPNLEGKPVLVLALTNSVDTTYSFLNMEKLIDIYKGESPIVVSGDTISHSDSGVTQGTAGEKTQQTPAFGETINVPYFTVNQKGHITEKGVSSVKIPNTIVSKTSSGLCPALPTTAGTTKYLREDGTWSVPPDTNTWNENKVNTAGYVSAPTSSNANKVWKTDANGNPAWRDDANTTYSVATQSANGLMSSNDKTKLDGIEEGANKYSLPTATSTTLGGVKSQTTGTTSGRDYKVQVNNDGTMKVNVPWTDTDTKYTLAELMGSSAKGGATQPVYWDGSKWTNTTYTLGKSVPSDAKFTDTTYSNFVKSGSSAKAGLVPAPSTTAGTTKYLREDGTWSVPPDTNTTYSAGTGLSLNGTAFSLAPDASVKEAYLSWGGKNFSGSYGCIDASMISELGANRFAFLRPDGITIEYSRDGGSTWTDYGSSNDAKLGLFSVGYNHIIGKADSNNLSTKDYKLRITIDTGKASIYTVLNKFCIYVSTNGGQNCKVTIQKALQSTPTTFVNTLATDVPISGWSGYNIINTEGIVTYGNTSSTQYGRIRFIFSSDGTNSTTYVGLVVVKIMAFGGVGWTTPSTMAKTGHLYSYDANQNATFPAQVTATKFNGTATGLSGFTNLTTTSASLNDMTSNGIWYTSSSSGVHTGTSGGHVLVGAYNTNWVTQWYQSYGDEGAYIRCKQSGTWKNWKKLIDSSDIVSKDSSGLCPALPNETTTTKYLRQDGTWAVPPDTNTNTWRGIQDNLTSSTNTTESLSAKQGYLLANGSARDSTKLPYGGNDSTLGQSSPASTYKERFIDNTAIPVSTIKMYYNSNGTEYSSIFSKGGSASYGSILAWGYADRYMRILRRQNGNWLSDDWEKMYAGYADTAGRATKLETYKQGSTTETYGASYPVYAQWRTGSNVRLKCDNYTTEIDYADTAGSATTASNLSGFTNRTTTSAAVNDMKSNGIWYANSSGIHSGTSDGQLLVGAYSTSWVTQWYQSYRNNGAYIRCMTNGTWNAWKKLIDSSDIGSQSVAYATNAGTVNNKTVGTNVPSDAKFTDTTPSVVTFTTGNITVAANSTSGTKTETIPTSVVPSGKTILGIVGYMPVSPTSGSATNTSNYIFYGLNVIDRTVTYLIRNYASGQMYCRMQFRILYV